MKKEYINFILVLILPLVINAKEEDAILKLKINCTQGYGYFCNKLGLYYEYKDNNKKFALYNYKRGCETGDPRSCKNLSRMNPKPIPKLSIKKKKILRRKFKRRNHIKIRYCKYEKYITPIYAKLEIFKLQNKIGVSIGYTNKEHKVLGTSIVDGVVHYKIALGYVEKEESKLFNKKICFK